LLFKPRDNELLARQICICHGIVDSLLDSVQLSTFRHAANDAARRTRQRHARRNQHSDIHRLHHNNKFILLVRDCEVGISVGKDCAVRIVAIRSARKNRHGARSKREHPLRAVFEPNKKIFLSFPFCPYHSCSAVLISNLTLVEDPAVYPSLTT
jgi:hypothetical protein